MTDIRGPRESERRSQLKRQLLQEMDEYYTYRLKRRQRIAGSLAMVLFLGSCALPFLFQEDGKTHRETLEQRPDQIEQILPDHYEIAEKPDEIPEDDKDEQMEFAFLYISDKELLSLLNEAGSPATFATINGKKRLLYLENDASFDER